MSALDDLIAAADARDAAYEAAPFDLGSGFDFGGFDFGTFNLGDLWGTPPIVAQPESLPSTGSGIRGLLGDFTRLVQIGYQGEALVNQQKALNKIAQAQLDNRLETVRTAPTIWQIGGLAAAGLVLWKVLDRGDRR